MLINSILTQLCHESLTEIVLDVGDYNLCAFLDKTSYRAGANAACAAGDNGHFICQSVHAVYPVMLSPSDG